MEGEPLPRALLSPEFIGELEALRRSMGSFTRSGNLGERLGKRRGTSAEFLEHRMYTPGDDLRRVDWLAYARVGEPVTKLFRAEEDILVRLFLDTSASLGVGTPTKIEAAKRVAAALGYMALANSERTQVLAGGARLHAVSEPSRGRGGVPRFLKSLESIGAAGSGNLAQALEEARRSSKRPGWFVVLSDFFDAGPVLATLRKLAKDGHDLVLVQVLAPEELDPDFDGDVALSDAETREVVEMTIDDAAVLAYRNRLAALFAELDELARQRRGRAIQISTAARPIEVVRSLLGARNDGAEARP